MFRPNPAKLRRILSVKELRKGDSLEHIGKQLAKACDVAGVATPHCLFNVYIQQNPLEQHEWIQLLFAALDIIDARENQPCTN